MMDRIGTTTLGIENMGVKQRIIVGAVGLINADGIKNTTMDAVAKSLGMSKRTIYEHFADKRALILACVHYVVSEQEKFHNKVVNESTDVIEEIAAVIGVMNNNSQFRGRVAADVKRLYPDIHQTIYGEFYHRSFDRMVDQLERGKTQGMIMESTNSSFAAYVILDSIHSLMVNPEKLLLATQVSPIHAFRYVLIFFFRGISTTKGIKKIDEMISRNAVL